MKKFDDSGIEFETEKIDDLLHEFLTEYAAKDDSMTDEDFLKKMFKNLLPNFSDKKINSMCKEIIAANDQMNDFLKESATEPGYSNATQNWFHEKIKTSIDDGDENFLNNIYMENEVLNTVNNQAAKMSGDFHKIGHIHNPGNTGGTSPDSRISGQIVKAEKTESSPKASANVHRAAIDAGVKRSLMTQYKKMMQLDFANLNFRADISNVAANLSRNAAMTGICGMMLTSGLSVLFKSGVAKRNLTKLVIKTGTIDGLRVAVAGALRAGAEKRLIPLLTRTTPMITFTAIALIAVESSKTIIEYVNGEVKCLEALNQVSKVSAICAVTFSIKGALVGAAAFAAVPVAAPAVGAFIGELVGSIAGYEIGRISYANLKSLLMTTKNILTANYGFLDILESETVTLKNKVNSFARQK